MSLDVANDMVIVRVTSKTHVFPACNVKLYVSVLINFFVTKQHFLKTAPCRHAFVLRSSLTWLLSPAELPPYVHHV